jgi:hypothetical protein
VIDEVIDCRLTGRKLSPAAGTRPGADVISDELLNVLRWVVPAFPRSVQKGAFFFGSKVNIDRHRLLAPYP